MRKSHQEILNKKLHKKISKPSVLHKIKENMGEQENSEEKPRNFCPQLKTLHLSVQQNCETHHKHFTVAVYKPGFSHCSNVAICKKQYMEPCYTALAPDLPIPVWAAAPVQDPRLWELPGLSRRWGRVSIVKVKHYYGEMRCKLDIILSN